MPSWLTIRNAGTQTEVLIYEPIGKDFWDGSGVTLASFREEWNAIPAGNEISLRVNSPGGTVWDGLPIHDLVAERRDRVTAYVEGIAASIASVIIMGAKRVVMPKGAEIFIHEAQGGMDGDADAMRLYAERLEKVSARIAEIYAAKTRKTPEEMRALMKANRIGSSFFGPEALAIGLCDEVTDAQPMQNNFDLSRFRRVPAGVTGGVKPPLTETPTQTKGSYMETNTQTTPQAEAPPTAAKPPANVIDVAEFNRVKAQLAEERSKRITNELHALAAVHEFDVADWKDRALADESVLAVLAKLPKRATNGVRPPIEVSDTEPSEPKNEIEAGVGFMKLDGNPKAAAAYYKAHKDKVLASVFNHSRTFTSPKAANTFTTLTHTVLASRAMEAFTYSLLPVKVFSTNFSADAVARGDKVKVLFTSSATAATDWAGSYTIQGATATGNDITIDQRKYVSWGLSTEEIMTQPQVNMDTFAIQKGNSLALAMLQDLFSLITEANYGSGALSATGGSEDYAGDQLVCTAGNFDIEEVACLYGAASVSNWPQMPRSLVLSIPYYARLFRESEVIGTEGLASSNPRMLQEAEIRRLLGFDIYETNAISASATDNVTGFICHPDAMLVAMRTLIPESGLSGSPSVRVLTDPATGASIVQREWFDADNDQSKRVLEVAYGRRVGNADALITIASS